MESLRRPSVLAAAAAALLVVNLVVLATDAGGNPDDGTPAAAPSTEAADEQEAQPDADDASEGTDGSHGTDGGNGTGEQPDADGAAGDGGAAGQSDGGEGAGGETAGEEPTQEQGADGAGLGTPTAGTYDYASSGTWSLSGGAQPEEHQLPETATGTVQVDGDAWQIRQVAGDRYADRFGFTLGPDGGLDWTTWVLERQFGSQQRNETSYTCSGDGAYYRPDEQGWTVEHDCESDAGIVSDGQVEHLGSEDVTLADGTVVTADRLQYTYTVSGSGSGFEVSGEGVLHLWLDPATGLRVREQRQISTTTTTDSGEQVYQEDVEFTLQSTQPS